MPIAATWVEYRNVSPYDMIHPEIPYLDFGAVQPNTYSAKRIVGLRFQGLGAEDIRFWLDGEKADVFPAGDNEPSPRVRLKTDLGWTFKYNALDAITPSPLTPVQAATTGNISSFSLTAPYIYDNVALGVGDRLLAKDQTTKSQNGVYTVTNVHSTSNLQWKRVGDLDASYEFSIGNRVSIQQGTVAVGKSYYEYHNSPFTAGTTASQWLDRTTRVTLAPCKVAHTNPATLPNVPNSINDYSLRVNDRLLLTAQASAVENGVYKVDSTFTPNTWRIAQDGNGIERYSSSKTKDIFVIDGDYCGHVYRPHPLANAPYSYGVTPVAYTDRMHWCSSTSVKIATTANVNLGAAPTAITDATGASIALSVGDRIAVRLQTLPKENGIYVVQSAGVWARATDFNISDPFKGWPLVHLDYRVATFVGPLNVILMTCHGANASGSPANFTLGTDSVLFDSYAGSGYYYYMPVVAIAGSNIVNLPNFSFSGATFGGVTVQVGDRVLVPHQSNAAQNGIYVVDFISGGTMGLVRAADFNASAHIRAYSSVEYRPDFSTLVRYELALPPGPYTLGTTALAWYVQSGNSYGVDGPVDTVSYANLVDGSVPDVIGGVTLVDTHTRILGVAQTDPAKNQQFTALYHTAGLVTSISRAADFNEQSELVPSQIVTTAGSNAGKTWELILPPSPVWGTSDIVWRDQTTLQSYAACRVASTANIALGSTITTGSEPTIDGVQIAVGDRVLLKNQTTAAENGIYALFGIATLSLARSTDLDSNAELSPFARVKVNAGGALYGDRFFGVWLPTIPATIDTTSQYWVPQPNTVRLNNCVVSTTTNISSLGSGAPRLVDNHSLSAGERVLVRNQSDATQNGIYTVLAPGNGVNGQWVRAEDLNDNADVVPQLMVYVDEGASAGKTDYFITLPAPQGSAPYYSLGTSAINWTATTNSSAFDGDPAGWSDLPISDVPPTDPLLSVFLDKAKLDYTLNAFSKKVGLSLRPGSLADSVITNFRLMASFNTTDE